MAYEKKEGDIFISPNKYKKESKHPDFTGTYHIKGKDYKVAFWAKKDGALAGRLSGELAVYKKPTEELYKEPGKSEHSTSDDLPF